MVDTECAQLLCQKVTGFGAVKCEADICRNDEPFGFKHLYAHKTPHFNLTFGVDFVCFDQPVLLTIKQAEI